MLAFYHTSLRMQRSLPKIYLLFGLSYLLLLPWTTTAEQFYVMPSNSTSCPRNPCYTLTDVVQNPSQYFASGTIIKFLPGHHQTNSSRNQTVLIKDMRNISLIGSDRTSGDSMSVIWCTGTLGFAFVNVTTLKIEKLTLLFCQAPILVVDETYIHPEHFRNYLNFTEMSMVTLYFMQTFNVIISEVAVYNSTGAGLLGVNMLGVSNISQTTVSGNGPNCWVIFLDVSSTSQFIPLTQFNIVQSKITFGRIPHYTHPEWGATGLVIMLAQKAYNVHIRINNIVTHGNRNMKKEYHRNGNYGPYGNLHFIIEQWRCYCSMIQATQISGTNNVGERDMATVSLNSADNSVCNCSKATAHAEEKLTVHISDSHFVGMGVRVDKDNFVQQSSYCDARIKLQNITVEYSTTFALAIVGMLSVELQNVSFINNHDDRTILILLSRSNVTVYGDSHFVHNTGRECPVKFGKSNISFYGDVKFIRNEDKDGSAMCAYNSTIKFHQTAEIVGNGGRKGGAMALFEHSKLVIGEHCNITFQNNHAELDGGAISVVESTIVVNREARLAFVDNAAGYNGGAIALRNGATILLGVNCRITFTGNHAQQYGGALYVEDWPLINYYSPGIYCFYQSATSAHNLLLPENIPSLRFDNNTADVAGDSLYGGWVDACIRMGMASAGDVFDALFHFRKELVPRQLSVVASNPTRVCVCVNTLPDCNVTQYNVTAYPGETFQIPAVAVGQRFGTVPFTVQTSFTSADSGNTPRTKPLQEMQKVVRTCTNLTYTIMSNHQNEKMILKVRIFDIPNIERLKRVSGYHGIEESVALQFQDLHVSIQMRSCPVGFVQYNSSCICHPQLQQRGINCSIDSQKVNRQPSMWINATLVNGSQSGVLVHEHCPFDYCKPESFDLNLEHPDEQCAFQRSGILCGACQQNLSQVFGTSRCRECSGLWALLWIPVIAATGIALVAMLIVLNLTVSMGTINGFIFYANIVRANQATFFPPNTTNSFLSWFIAWINLDLGIETCFYNGLDAYVKTWLQLVFPLYIWFLAFIIIISSYYSTIAARLSGRNAVQVLATLVLLSYAKLLRIIITVFQSTELVYPDTSVRKVWLYDGNVDYLKLKHMLLFVAAVFLLLLSLLYTAILIFIQCLQHRSKYKVLFWVKKLKPLFDAYTGPYKERHRYWTGLLLLVRIVLFLVFSTNVLGDPAINLLATCTAVLCIQLHTSFTGGTYKVWYLNALEFFSVLNLGLLSCATLYVRSTGGNQTACIYTSATVAVATFSTIIILHLIVSVKSSRMWKNVSKRRNQQKPQPPAVQDSCEEAPQPNRAIDMQEQILTFDELREPLLEYWNPPN